MVRSDVVNNGGSDMFFATPRENKVPVWQAIMKRVDDYCKELCAAKSQETISLAIMKLNSLVGLLEESVFSPQDQAKITEELHKLAKMKSLPLLVSLALSGLALQFEAQREG